MTLSCPPQAVAPEQHGIVLFAHGSRDPQWRAPIEAVAALNRWQDALGRPLFWRGLCRLDKCMVPLV